MMRAMGIDAVNASEEQIEEACDKLAHLVHAKYQKTSESSTPGAVEAHGVKRALSTAVKQTKSQRQSSSVTGGAMAIGGDGAGDGGTEAAYTA